ncbi:MAG TPA: hypothetical protein VMV31_02735 [Terriglobales bacterium]|nr:hypothetical protein [Terriglobales bacterium]
MAIASSLVSIDVTRRKVRRTLNLALSGNYATGGDTLDLTATTNPNNFEGAKAFGRVPAVYGVENAPDGYSAEIVAGAALNNWKVKWFTASNTELAAGAYPAGLSGAADIRVQIASRTNL